MKLGKLCLATGNCILDAGDAFAGVDAVDASFVVAAADPNVLHLTRFRFVW